MCRAPGRQLSFNVAMTQRIDPMIRLASGRSLAVTLPLATWGLVALGWVVVIPEASAKNCEASGGLRYLGTSSNGARTVWLSSTSPGQFTLDAAQGNQTVDAWSRQRRGLHVSLSPVVSNGNGGTHKLNATEGGQPCLLDSQNQSGGIVFPAGPPFPPPGLRPPVTGLLPGVPAAVKPPIGVLPPTGVMPTLPGTVTPPIGVLPPTPPTGLTPTLPGTVTPPIGVLPPTPPTGVMPTLPGTVTPPIGVLPPTGVMPTLPGTVTPPIGVLPPTPPTGLTPTLPGTVTPPIGVLPPTPPTGLTPTLPGTVTPPIGVLPPDTTRSLAAAGTTVDCPGGGLARNGNAGAGSNALDCRDPLRPAPAANPIPLTEGRDLGLDSLWNGWIDLRRTDGRDRRNGIELDSTTGGLTLGTDRRFGADLIAGFSLSVDRGDTTAFDGVLTTRTRGFLAGPYLAYRVSNDWVIDTSLDWGQGESDVQLDVLAGQYTTRRYAFSFNANGQYEHGQTVLRPRLSYYYANTRSNSYEMRGNVAGESIGVALPQISANTGLLEASGEIHRTYRLPDNSPIVPYARLAVRYEFARSNDGEVMTGDLASVSTSRWGGSLRAGARTVVGRATLIEAEAGYLSLGQQDLNLWQVKLYPSHAF
jgi:Autotransporter beta-domain